MPTMIVTTRGADPTTKAIMGDIGKMVHGTVEDTFDVRKEVSLLVTYMDVNDCENAIYFEVSKRQKRLWVATATMTLRFEVLGQQSVFELSTVANYHKGAGHVLLFSKDFDESEQLQAVKAVLERAFGGSESEGVERAMCFFYVDGVVAVRNYLIKGTSEIGPRMDLKLERIFDGCFKGKRLNETNE